MSSSRLLTAQSRRNVAPMSREIRCLRVSRAGDVPAGALGGRVSGVLSVAAGWSRAAELLRTRRLASASAASVVIASFWGWAELADGRWSAGSGLLMCSGPGVLAAR